MSPAHLLRRCEPPHCSMPGGPEGWHKQSGTYNIMLEVCMCGQTEKMGCRRRGVRRSHSLVMFAIPKGASLHLDVVVNDAQVVRDAQARARRHLRHERLQTVRRLEGSSE